MGNPIDSIKNMVEGAKKAKKKAAWEADLKKTINRVNVLADIETECTELEKLINVEVKKIRFENITELEKQMSKKRIDNAYCCVTVLKDAKRNLSSTYADNDIFDVAKQVAKTLDQVNRSTSMGFSFGTKNLGKMVNAIKENEDERNEAMENLIPRIMSSSELNTISERLIKGDTLNSCLESEENISIESQIQSVMMKGMAGIDDGLKTKLDDLKKFK